MADTEYEGLSDTDKFAIPELEAEMTIAGYDIEVWTARCLGPGGDLFPSRSLTIICQGEDWGRNTPREYWASIDVVYNEIVTHCGYKPEPPISISFGGLPNVRRTTRPANHIYSLDRMMAVIQYVVKNGLK